MIEDHSAPLDRWLEALYDCLHGIAAAALARENPGHTLQPTALVNEAYVRMSGGSTRGWNDERHFLAVAARVVREILVDHARRRGAVKRGRGWLRVTMDGQPRTTRTSVAAVDLLDLDEALKRLAASHERAAQVVELRFFSGLTVDEAAEALDVSAGAIDYDWRFARAWLARELERV